MFNDLCSIINMNWKLLPLMEVGYFIKCFVVTGSPFVVLGCLLSIFGHNASQEEEGIVL